MNAAEHQLQYPLGDVLPAPGKALTLAHSSQGGHPVVKWLRMGLPFALDHINLWLLRDECPASDGSDQMLQGWAVVDCGITNARTQSDWEQIFAQELDDLPILRVIVTHMHPDHIGLAHWLCARWSTPAHTCHLHISATDYNAARIGSHSTTGFGGEAAAQFFASHGLTDAHAQQQIRARTHYYPSLVPDVPRQFVRLQDGQTLRMGGLPWQCISGYGHAPEHIALYCAPLGLLISGDMVLPRISTNVSVFDVEPEANPLAAFLGSIDKFKTLPADTLVLPSHGKPFVGLHQRIEQLHAHHQERLAEVQAACTDAPRTAAEVLPVLFKRTLDLHQTTFAMGESIAHLHALWRAGTLRRARGADGLWRFAADPAQRSNS